MEISHIIKLARQLWSASHQHTLARHRGMPHDCKQQAHALLHYNGGFLAMLILSFEEVRQCGCHTFGIDAPAVGWWPQGPFSLCAVLACQPLTLGSSCPEKLRYECCQLVFVFLVLGCWSSSCVLLHGTIGSPYYGEHTHVSPSCERLTNPCALHLRGGCRFCDKEDAPVRPCPECGPEGHLWKCARAAGVPVDASNAAPGALCGHVFLGPMSAGATMRRTARPGRMD